MSWRTNNGRKRTEKDGIVWIPDGPSAVNTVVVQGGSTGPTGPTGPSGTFGGGNLNMNGYDITNIHLLNFNAPIQILPSDQFTNNIAIGFNALFNTNPNYNPGTQNIAIGTISQYYNTTNSLNNVSIGYNALVQGGVNNTACGSFALGQSAYGNNNTAVGNSALAQTSGEGMNSAVGAQSLSQNYGNKNTAFGYKSLYINRGNFNTAIGYNSNSEDNSYTNTTCLGANSTPSGNNTVQLGDAATNTYYYNSIGARSDMRDKVDIQPTQLGLTFINKLKPVDYKWDYREDYYTEKEVLDDSGNVIRKERIYYDSDHTKKRTRFHHGLIAQDVKNVIDETGIDFGGYQDHKINGGLDRLTLGYSELIGPLIKSVQELSAKNQQLEEKINLLLSKV